MKTHSALNQKEISSGTVIKVFASLAVVAFLLRIFYSSHLFQDDGLWFTAAEEILRGKVLYKEIYFDKPPALPLLYALLFKLFGAHISTIRLFTVVYSLAVAFALYLFGAFLYNKRAGLFAAAMFVVFSTTFSTGHFQGLNTDMLMTLPYTLGAYWFTRACTNAQASRAKRLTFALAAGTAVGLAFQINPKALFDLLFFALCSLFFFRIQDSGFRIDGQRVKSQASAVENQDSGINNPQSAIRNPQSEPSQSELSQSKLPTSYCLLLTASGLLLGALPFWLYLAANDALADYRVYVWDWGAKYAAYFSLKDSLQTALTQNVGYFALNNVLLIGLLFVAVKAYKRWRKPRKQGSDAFASEVSKQATGADFTSQRFFYADRLLLLWVVISFAGMSLGGRFFGHYFLQILPALCLLTGRAVLEIVSSLQAAKGEERLFHKVLIIILGVGFLFTFARFHVRTAVLAMDWLRGSKSQMTQLWYHEKLNKEERLIAATVKDLPDDFFEAEKLDVEGLRGKDWQSRDAEENADALFVWGYRPEIYFWSGLRPASRFLSAQLLTGVPADVQFFGESYAAVLDEKTTAAYRLQLLQDLQAKRPLYIIDELGFFNEDLAMSHYPELKEFLADYKFIGSKGRFLIYYRPKVKEKNKRKIDD